MSFKNILKMIRKKGASKDKPKEGGYCESVASSVSGMAGLDTISLLSKAMNQKVVVEEVAYLSIILAFFIILYVICMVFFQVVLGGIHSKGSDIYELDRRWWMIYFQQGLFYYYTMENYYYRDGTSVQAAWDGLFTGYSLTTHFDKWIEYYSNTTTVATQNFYGDVWNDTFSTDSLVIDLMNATSKNVYYEYTKTAFIKKTEKELTLTVASLSWISTLFNINKLIKANASFTNILGVLNSSIMYLTDNLANVLFKGYNSVTLRFQKMYNRQNDGFRVGFYIFISVFVMMLCGSIGLIIYLLVVLNARFKFVYECYAKLKHNEIELQKLLNKYCLQLFSVYKFNEKKLISVYLDNEILYKEKELEVKERSANVRQAGGLYDVRRRRQLPSVKNTFIKSIGLALLFSLYIVILVVVEMKIYNRFDIDRYRIKLYTYKGYLDHLYLDFFYITTTSDINVNYTDPTLNLDRYVDQALMYPKLFADSTPEFSTYFAANQANVENLLYKNYCTTAEELRKASVPPRPMDPITLHICNTFAGKTAQEGI